jgi:uncharacterized protein (DUF1778 family)
MAKKKPDGNESPTMPVRLEMEAVRLARIAAPMLGQSVQAFASESISLRAQDVIEKFSREQISNSANRKKKPE